MQYFDHFLFENILSLKKQAEKQVVIDKQSDKQIIIEKSQSNEPDPLPPLEKLCDGPDGQEINPISECLTYSLWYLGVKTPCVEYVRP